MTHTPEMRVWIPEQKRFADNWQLQSDGLLRLQIDPIPVMHYTSQEIHFGLVIIDKWTGLFDIHNNPVYQNDIIQPMEIDWTPEEHWIDDEYEKPYVIPGEYRWNCGCCCYVYGFDFDKSKQNECSNFRIIGNVHQNPELIP